MDLVTRIGLVPTASTTHTEPFHVSTAIAALDYVSSELLAREWGRR